MQTFNIRQGNTLPVLKVAITQGVVGAMSAMDLTGYTAKFDMFDSDGTKVLSGLTATITDAAGGKVQYAWASGNTATSGLYRGQFDLTRTADGATLTVPNRVEDELWISIRVE
jgi:hypothetical protein